MYNKSKKTKGKLASLKEYERENFEEVINKLLVLIPNGDDEGKYTDEFRAGLLEALYEARSGKLIPFEKVKKEIGLE